MDITTYARVRVVPETIPEHIQTGESASHPISVACFGPSAAGF